jgi:threonine dehydratase
MAPAPSVTLADVEAAAAGIAGQVVHTPTMRSRTLSLLTGAEVWVKFENLQFTSSFKDRGALWRLLQLTPGERERGVIAMSAGNHAQGVAYHAGRLGIPATIVMPRFTPNVKVAGTEALGARVVLHGDSLAEARSRADELAAEQGLVFVPPYDDRFIVAGQGSCGLELLEDAPPLDVLLVPVGGGGLLAGIAVVFAARSPATELLGVESELYPAMADVLAGREPAGPGGATIAEGIAVTQAGELTRQLIREKTAGVITVKEDSIEDAVMMLLEIEKTVVEGAGAAGLAAVLEDPERFRDRRVGIVLSGGNIDPRLLASVLLRGLVRSGRLTRLNVGINDVPGQLSAVTRIIGDLGGNIVEVQHQRMFSDLSAKRTVLEVAVETRDRAHIDQLVAALRAAGYRVDRQEVE